MPTQVLPITDLAKAGVIMDTPAVSLPPNVFSDCRNVRFRDGAIRKMEGEQEIIFNIGQSDLIFVAYWQEPSLSPDDGYIVIVARRDATMGELDRYRRMIVTTQVDEIYVFQASDPDTVIHQSGLIQVYTNTQWQHTLFGGGSTFVLNNRTEKPIYAIGPISVTQSQVFFDLPGWDSYLVDEQVTSFFYDTAFLGPNGTDLGTFVNLTDTTGQGLPDGVDTLNDQNILATIIPADNRIDPFQIRVRDYRETVIAPVTPVWDTNEQYAAGDRVLYTVLTSPETVINIFTAVRPNMGVIPQNNALDWRDDGQYFPPVSEASVGYDENTGTTFITFTPRRVNAAGLVEQQGVLQGDSVTIRVQTEPEIQVRAGVVRTYGDLLIAGNLTEMERSNPSRIVRNMPGVIRTSDVAAPGSIPANWNPFKTGVNTAEEVTLSSTGIIQDMVELQGIMYVYTNESIHSIQATGNPTVPFNIRPVAAGWGAQTIDAVQEFDGKHLVIGSSDIYVFAGHPGSIQSIADLRVRRFFFQDLNPMYEQNLFTLLYRRRDEIWVNYPGMDSTDGQCTRTLIWNYRNNTWTVRQQSSFWNGVVSPIQPNGDVDPNEFFPLLASTKREMQDPNDPTVMINDPDSIFVADATGRYMKTDSTGYESYVERQRLAMTPEFTTENLLSVAMLTELRTGVAYSDPTNLRINATGTNTPSATVDLRHEINNTPNPDLGVTALFDIREDYKVDLREHGRLLNHRITDNMRDIPWAIAGLQFDIGSGGTR